jgi:hypothetical protein
MEPIMPRPQPWPMLRHPSFRPDNLVVALVLLLHHRATWSRLAAGTLGTRSYNTTAEDSRSCHQHEHMLSHLDLLDCSEMSIQLRPSYIDPSHGRPPAFPKLTGLATIALMANDSPPPMAAPVG